MSNQDIAALIHPLIAVTFVFPLIGISVYFAWQTRQRRLQLANGDKSKIAPVVGAAHVQLGKWLSAAVVGIALLGLAYPIFSKILAGQTWTTAPFRVVFIVLMYVATIASLILLYQAKPKIWRAIFATLTGAGLVILGCQPEVYRRGFEWYVSHYYYGIAAAMLMIFSLAIIPDIYQDRQNRWRSVHVMLNCIALLLFVWQGFTGTRDLLEIPLSWQTPYIQQLYEQQCQTQPCAVQPAPQQN